jgi:hypothetical protein
LEPADGLAAVPRILRIALSLVVRAINLANKRHYALSGVTRIYRQTKFDSSSVLPVPV